MQIQRTRTRTQWAHQHHVGVCLELGHDGADARHEAGQQRVRQAVDHARRWRSCLPGGLPARVAVAGVPPPGARRRLEHASVNNGGRLLQPGEVGHCRQGQRRGEGAEDRWRASGDERPARWEADLVTSVWEADARAAGSFAPRGCCGTGAGSRKKGPALVCASTGRPRCWKRCMSRPSARQTAPTPSTRNQVWPATRLLLVVPPSRLDAGLRCCIQRHAWAAASPHARGGCAHGVVAVRACTSELHATAAPDCWTAAQAQDLGQHLLLHTAHDPHWPMPPRRSPAAMSRASLLSAAVVLTATGLFALSYLTFTRRRGARSASGGDHLFKLKNNRGMQVEISTIGAAITKCARAPRRSRSRTSCAPFLTQRCCWCCPGLQADCA